MKFSTAFLALTALASAAPAPTGPDPSASDVVPKEAILGSVQLSDEVIAWYSNETTQFIFLNNTILQQAKTEAALGKREAWGWVQIWPGQPFWKRDTEAKTEGEASLEKREAWGWVQIWPGQPFWKRDTEAADASLEKREAWGWVQIWPGQPFW